MPKFSQISGKQMIKILQKAGFVVISQKGSHIKFRKSNHTVKTVIVPNHKIIRPGTLNNILRTAEITKDKLEDYL